MIAAVTGPTALAAVFALPHVDRAAAGDLEERKRRAVTREPADLVRGGALVATYQVDLRAAETPPERRALPEGTA